MPDPTFSSNYPSAVPPPQPETPVPPQDQQVFAMPERFRGPVAGAKGGGGGKRWLLWTVLIVLIVGGVGVGSYFLFSMLSNANANENANANVIVANGNQNASNQNASNRNANANVNQATNSGGFNTNSTGNANAGNANGALNGNANANANANSNSNGNANVALNANATNGNTNASATPRSPLPSSLDTDGDGLTDLEESQIYGTDPRKPDTDGDGFIDGKQITATGTVGEVYLGYHPNGTGSLSASSLVKTFENSTQRYAIQYPSTWTMTKSDALEKTVLLSPASSTGEFVQVSIQDNPDQVSPKNWYVSLNPGVTASQVSEITVNGLLGAVSLDGQSIYLGKGSTIYALTYDSGTLSQVNYRTTFEMMEQSFRLLAATNTNS